MGEEAAIGKKDNGYMANINTRRRRRRRSIRTGSCPVISQNHDRNMELVIVGGRTVYRPMDPAQSSFPARTNRLNQIRRRWGRSEGETISAILKVLVGRLDWATFGGTEEEAEAA